MLEPQRGGKRKPEGWSPPKRRPKQVQPQRNPAPSEEDRKRYARMRTQRAERLERKDLTAQMTETKTYMGGFTQPRHFKFLDIMDPQRTAKAKDSYDVRVGANRVRPAAEAYEPHTVYLGVTRYPVRWGHGRATRREVISGFCKETELEERFKHLNYGMWNEAKTELVKLRHGSPREPVHTPAHWGCREETKEYLELAVLPGSPEERSLLNKPTASKISALTKELKMLNRAEMPDEARVKELQAEMSQLRTTLLPPRKDYVRPPPPYTTPPLVVPFLTVTLPTRPLAATLARLCKSHPRGLPFIASIPDEDRKDGPALFRRLLRLRTDRLQGLTQELVRKIQGHGGGLMSLRLSPEDKGRGIEGEGLEEEIKPPTERGWAEYSWLDGGSACWEGIAKEMYPEKWAGVEEASRGPDRKDDAEWKEQHPLVKKVAGEEGKKVRLPALEMEDDIAEKAEASQ
ncbi:hypothetical protein JCM8547_002389 [Rhodosporidiobolus lusitaniae]